MLRRLNKKNQPTRKVLGQKTEINFKDRPSCGLSMIHLTKSYGVLPPVRAAAPQSYTSQVLYTLCLCSGTPNEVGMKKNDKS
jgi:hypothetical protein